MDKLSYALGLSLGRNVKEIGVEALDSAKMVKGIQDVLEGNEPEMTIQEAQAIMNEYFQNLQAQKNAEVKIAGEKFLAENAKRKEVSTTASGLQYEVLVAAEGAKPAATNTVKVHYEGTLIDGTIFDSSYQRGEPISFGLNQVIAGWTEGLQLMSVGAKYKLYIPYQLAYGEQGAGGQIPGGAALIFTVELLDFN